ncbi:hypothetical protein CONPUDRAFT_154706 [Coniophora puteana RWD-64-598 SS2]|uniref:F-box domain-containing protein n=1 Tax=Coniophora puteana (strain RWD-64-598) TaxID=741705 RepID=A0A5M3MPR5_CONPW|nr:uncharacterized protein CONPUDRAFT_154706 [Coniophora puteana RWD-64-598 SS2]EIW80694.1 hypothetical protein CONPUDRAFT_154706 [Coniophora puteana RWD-64-598 SS2]
MLNAPSKLLGLPNELLAEILKLCSIDDCFSVTGVCRRLYDVAASLPQLWTDIILIDSQPNTWVETQAMIRRSFPLCFTFSLAATELPDADQRDSNNSYYDVMDLAIRTEAHRLRRLNVVLTGLTQHNLLENHLLTSMPNLEYLELTGDGTDERPIPSTFLAGCAPRLRRLDLDNIALQWDSPLIGNQLTYLRLADLPQRLAPSTQQMLMILRATPSLQALIISDVLPQQDQLSVPFYIRHSSHDNKVTLPELRNLDLAGDFGDCGALLAYLDVPKETESCIRTRSSADGHLDDIPLLPADAFSFKDNDTMMSEEKVKPDLFRTLDIEFTTANQEGQESDCHIHWSHPQCNISVYDSKYSSRDEALSPVAIDETLIESGRIGESFTSGLHLSSSFSSDCNCYGGHDHLNATFKPLVGTSRLCDVDTLRIKTLIPGVRSSWRALLGAASSARVLDLDMDQANLKAILNELDASDVMGGKESPMLPALSELHLFWPYEEDAMFSVVTPQHLVRLLARRVEAGLPPVKLAIKGYDVQQVFRGFEGSLERLTSTPVEWAEYDDDMDLTRLLVRVG